LEYEFKESGGGKQIIERGRGGGGRFPEKPRPLPT